MPLRKRPRDVELFVGRLLLSVPPDSESFFSLSSPSVVVSTLFARLWGRESGKQHTRQELRSEESRIRSYPCHRSTHSQPADHTPHHAPHTTRAHAHPYTSTRQAHKNRIADCRELAAR